MAQGTMTMVRFNQHGLPILEKRPTDMWSQLKELTKFFNEKDPVHKTMRKVAQRLDKAGIPYAVAGGMAVFAHKHRRATNDVDILLTQAGFDEFQRKFVPKTYDRVPDRAKRFFDVRHEVTIDVLVTGRFPGTGKPGPIAYPDPEAVKERIDDIYYLNLTQLIELKLAAQRYQDFADVANLIAANQLDESFAQQLHESVRTDYLGCWDEYQEELRREEYESKE